MSGNSVAQLLLWGHQVRRCILKSFFLHKVGTELHVVERVESPSSVEFDSRCCHWVSKCRRRDFCAIWRRHRTGSAVLGSGQWGAQQHGICGLDPDRQCPKTLARLLAVRPLAFSLLVYPETTCIALVGQLPGGLPSFQTPPGSRLVCDTGNVRRVARVCVSLSVFHESKKSR